MPEGAEARWWAVRRVRSEKPATYTCPFCGELLHAMSDHVLIAPEADGNRRRHAHTACVLAAREAGRLPTRDEWRAGGGTRRRADDGNEEERVTGIEPA